MSPHGRRIRTLYDITGVVQGVGFRPTLFRLARERGLGGSVQNRRGSVRLILEGERSGVEGLMDDRGKVIRVVKDIDRVSGFATEKKGKFKKITRLFLFFSHIIRCAYKKTLCCVLLFFMT
jgi:hydrogenase maturation factor HypF (carbamoyltransferase family)